MRLFDHMEKQQRDRLLNLATEIHVSTGELIIRRGEQNADVYRLLRGSLEVLDSRAIPEVVFDVLEPGAVVGEMAFLEDRPRSADVRAGENVELLRWQGGDLRQTLDGDPELAASFYRAAAKLLSERVRATSSMAVRGGLGGESVEGLTGDAKARGQSLANRLKSQLVDLENALRLDPDGPAREALATVLNGFIEQGGRTFSGMPFEESQAAGGHLSRELHPYLARSKLVELVVTRFEGGGWAQLHGHVYRNEAQGTDSMGVALDEALLGLPTTIAIRERKDAFVRVGEVLLAGKESPKILVVPSGTGVVTAKLGQVLARVGAEITCADSDSTSLGALDSGLTTRPSKVALHTRYTDTALIALGRDVDLGGPFDLIIVDGLLDYIPDRVMASLAGTVMKHLKPGMHALFSQLSPTHDAFLFDHLLGWSMVRREPQSVVDLFKSIGFAESRVVWQEGVGVVVSVANSRDSS
jgi:CRP/FNR family cyclic AMP-dependent transcriptional regulator